MNGITNYNCQFRSKDNWVGVIKERSAKREFIITFVIPSAYRHYNELVLMSKIRIL